jgi:hypothetical protein
MVTLTISQLRELIRAEIDESLFDHARDQRPEPELIDGREVARRCNVSRQTVFRWRVAGCPAIRTGDTYRYRFADVVHWLEAGGARP